ncbi:MAG: cobalamin-binding protein, partial [Thermoplasmata archaeon]|nr:cobalamin-binding protein [Thermoplasmata archaeon]
PCSFSVDRTRTEADSSGVRTSVAALHPRLGTWLADEAYFSRPGPRLADGVDLVRDLIGGRAPSAPMPVEQWGR